MWCYSISRILLNSSKISNLQKQKYWKNFMDHAAIQFSKIKVKNRFQFLSLLILNSPQMLIKSIRLSASEKYLKNNKANISGMFMIIHQKYIKDC